MSNLALKRDLTAEQLAMVDSEFEKRKKSKGIMYALWWFTTIFGGQRFYLGDTGRALCLLFLGWLTLFIWNLVDVFFIGKRLEEVNEQIEYDIIQNVIVHSKAKNESAPTE